MLGKFGGITSSTRQPGHGGERKGAGWGMPPGDHSPTPKQPFTAESPTRMVGTVNQTDPATRLTREEKALRDEGRAEKYRQFIDDTVSNEAASAETRLRASAMGLDRIEGTPIARNINVNSDDISKLSDAEIAAELARLGRNGAKTAPGTETEDGST